MNRNGRRSNVKPKQIAFFPYKLPDQCFLIDVLFWLAFRRLPIQAYDPDGATPLIDDETGFNGPDLGDRN